MKLDKAIKNFTEKYDRTAMQYIEKVSSEFGLVYNKQSIPAFNMSEAFNKFEEYIEGYSDYKIRLMSDDTLKNLPYEEITETTKKWCESVFKDSELAYNDIPTFIESYINGVNSLIGVIESNKKQLMEEDVNSKDIGAINEYADIFMDALDSKFESVMDKILMASGYTSTQRLNGKVEAPKKDIVYFI